MVVAQAAAVKSQMPALSCKVVLAWLRLLRLQKKVTMMTAAQVLEMVIPMRSAPASRRGPLVDPTGVHGVEHLTVKRSPMDLHSVVIFAQMMRKSRRRCMISS
jgi:hypothetical protein